jgi:hypothetical protein
MCRRERIAKAIITRAVGWRSRAGSTLRTTAVDKAACKLGRGILSVVRFVLPPAWRVRRLPTLQRGPYKKRVRTGPRAHKERVYSGP